ncbi:MAG: 2,3-bisphosphoglycerate-independent phosphoglycerate mutase [Bacteroidota bacterium]
MNPSKVVLIIMDGWGHGRKDKSNAIFMANTPFVDSLYPKYPNTELRTSGEDVGLPDGQMGNSEVGHLNIGAGRVVYQDLVKVNVAIRDNILHKNTAVLSAINYCKTNNKKLHLIGLVSDGGVHSHIKHLKALCDIAHENNLSNVFIHAFTDGRDTDPKGGLNYLNDLNEHLKHSSGKIASIVGRYYAMDRDKRWERIKIAYDLLVNGIGHVSSDYAEAIKASYAEDVSDEFIKPIVITGSDSKPLATIQDGDAVICFNFRTDRCREITTVLTQSDFHEQNMHKLNLKYVTMSNYDDTFKNVDIIFDKDNLVNTLGEVLADNNKSQIRVAETEKYPHVTFFFSGGRELPFVGETRIMIPSPKVATYDLQPQMSAPEMTTAICEKLSEGKTDFVCLNFANTDMVGHTGVFSAVVTAAETVDACVKKVVETGLAQGYTFLITADHGNADFMINDDGTPNTAHTTNPVPLFLVGSEYKNLKPGRLADLAPTVLHLMKLPIPKEMTGQVLVS